MLIRLTHNQPPASRPVRTMRQDGRWLPRYAPFAQLLPSRDGANKAPSVYDRPGSDRSEPEWGRHALSSHSLCVNRISMLASIAFVVSITLATRGDDVPPPVGTSLVAADRPAIYLERGPHAAPAVKAPERLASAERGEQPRPAHAPVVGVAAEVDMVGASHARSRTCRSCPAACFRQRTCRKWSPGKQPCEAGARILPTP